jgi:hypothetical protein
MGFIQFGSVYTGKFKRPRLAEVWGGVFVSVVRVPGWARRLFMHLGYDQSCVPAATYYNPLLNRTFSRVVRVSSAPRGRELVCVGWRFSLNRKDGSVCYDNAN